MKPNFHLNQVVRIGFFLSIIVITATSFSWVPPAEMSGAPGDGTCLNCHISTSTDSEVLFSKAGGTTYHSMQTYDLSLKIKNPGANIFGFILTEIDSSHKTSGEFGYSDSSRYFITHQNERAYISHYNAEDSSNLRQDAAEFSFTWTAPDTAAGPITFYYCGRAVNPDDLVNDLLTYCDSFTITPSLSPLGLDESITKTSETTVYPNPGNSELNIQNIPKSSSIKVLDAKGNVMFESRENTESSLIQTNEWPSGFYFIYIDGKEKTLMKWVKI